MTAYIGIVGPSLDYSAAWQSILKIARAPGDAIPMFVHGTKGYESRQRHIDEFLQSNHDELLLLDSDMVFAEDTLARLRAWGEPFVSGFYMRRNYRGIAPVWFEPEFDFPVMPFMRDPERGRLHELGASGWGCIYLRREVIEKTMPLLQGEPVVLEDDMDLWPYNLDRLMEARRGALRLLGEEDGPAHAAELERLLRIFVDEIRPLRLLRDSVGSDIRFPWYARQAGFTLWGDPDVRPGHIVHYPLSADDYASVPEAERERRRLQVREQIEGHRQKAREQMQLWT